MKLLGAWIEVGGKLIRVCIYKSTMRILILTHPRSGGFSLLSWLTSEMEQRSYHEPLIHGPLCDDFRDSLSNPQVIVKEHLQSLVDAGLDPLSFINSFDRVIFHVRTNLEDCSVSTVQQNQTGNSHLPYALDSDWLEIHQEEISRVKSHLAQIQKDILEQSRQCVPPSILTSYEGVYVSGEDIPLILDFLNLYDPQWLDIIHPKRRLRDGDSSLAVPRKKVKLI